MKLSITFIILISLLILNCDGQIANTNLSDDRDYRQEMRDFVRSISSYAKGRSLDFLIIPQNGHELITENGLSDGYPAVSYLNAIDGIGREDLFYGYEQDDQATPDTISTEMIAFLRIAKSNGLDILVTDYCSKSDKMDDSYTQNASRGYISFAATHRELDNIPGNPYLVNSNNIIFLFDTKNFLYLIDPGSFTDKNSYLSGIRNTNYDLLIIDYYYDEEPLTSNDVTSLKTKANGGSRLVLAYMSIGEAEDYRYYWDSFWEDHPPSWLAGENPYWEGNYKVKYWDPDWQSIIFGNDSSYVQRIINAGFDGAYLDIIDAFEYFE